LAAPKEKGFKGFVVCLAKPRASDKAAGLAEPAESSLAGGGATSSQSGTPPLRAPSSSSGQRQDHTDSPVLHPQARSSSSGQRHDHTDSPGQAPAPLAGGWILWRCVGQFEHDDGAELKAKFDASYKVGATIGQGTFGKVFGAVRRSDNAAVAVKAFTFAWLMMHTR